MNEQGNSLSEQLSQEQAPEEQGQTKTEQFQPQPDPRSAYGGFWRRVGAVIIDGIILGVIFTPLSILVGAADNEAGQEGGGVALLQSLTVVIAWLYYALMESSSLQATIGKLAVGVMVTNTDGQRISFLRATGRYFAKFLSSIILMIGYIMVAFTAKRQGLHDMLVDTLVVRGRNK